MALSQGRYQSFNADSSLSTLRLKHLFASGNVISSGPSGRAIAHLHAHHGVPPIHEFRSQMRNAMRAKYARIPAITAINRETLKLTLASWPRWLASSRDRSLADGDEAG
jgi:hypothetical protein